MLHLIGFTIYIYIYIYIYIHMYNNARLNERQIYMYDLGIHVR